MTTEKGEKFNRKGEEIDNRKGGGELTTGRVGGIDKRKRGELTTGRGGN